MLLTSRETLGLPDELVIGSVFTVIYTWRMIFRAFFGDPSPEATELEAGHLHHVDVHRNPVTGFDARVTQHRCEAGRRPPTGASRKGCGSSFQKRR